MTRGMDAPGDHPADEALVELLEAPDDEAVQSTRAHVEACLRCQEVVDGLLMVYDRLELPAWMEATRLSAEKPAEDVPEALVRKILERTRGTGPNGRNASFWENHRRWHRQHRGDLAVSTRSDPAVRTAPGSGSTAAWWKRVGRPMLGLAAVLLVGVPVLWNALRPTKVDPGGGDTDDAWRMKGDPATADAAPVKVMILRPGAAHAEAFVPVTQEQGRWRVEVPSRALLQLRVMRPAGALSWAVQVRCERPGHGAFPLTADGRTRWEAEADSTDDGLAVGDTRDLAALGVEPSDRLACQVRRTAREGASETGKGSDESFELELRFLSDGAPGR